MLQLVDFASQGKLMILHRHGEIVQLVDLELKVQAQAYLLLMLGLD